MERHNCATATVTASEVNIVDVIDLSFERTYMTTPLPSMSVQGFGSGSTTLSIDSTRAPGICFSNSSLPSSNQPLPSGTNMDSSFETSISSMEVAPSGQRIPNGHFVHSGSGTSHSPIYLTLGPEVISYCGSSSLANKQSSRTSSIDFRTRMCTSFPTDVRLVTENMLIKVPTSTANYSTYSNVPVQNTLATSFPSPTLQNQSSGNCTTSCVSAQTSPNPSNQALLEANASYIKHSSVPGYTASTVTSLHVVTSSMDSPSHYEQLANKNQGLQKSQKRFHSEYEVNLQKLPNQTIHNQAEPVLKSPKTTREDRNLIQQSLQDVKEIRKPVEPNSKSCNTRPSQQNSQPILSRDLFEKLRSYFGNTDRLVKLPLKENTSEIKEMHSDEIYFQVFSQLARYHHDKVIMNRNNNVETAHQPSNLGGISNAELMDIIFTTVTTNLEKAYKNEIAKMQAEYDKKITCLSSEKKNFAKVHLFRRMLDGISKRHTEEPANTSFTVITTTYKGFAEVIPDKNPAIFVKQLHAALREVKVRSRYECCYPKTQITISNTGIQASVPNKTQLKFSRFVALCKDDEDKNFFAIAHYPSLNIQQIKISVFCLDESWLCGSIVETIRLELTTYLNEKPETLTL